MSKPSPGLRARCAAWELHVTTLGASASSARVWIAVTSLLALSSGCSSTCIVRSQSCLLAERADKTLKCQRNVNGGSFQSATIYEHAELPDGDRYEVCCGNDAKRCQSYFCPKGQPVSACLQE